jgi:hypothetical protein
MSSSVDWLIRENNRRFQVASSCYLLATPVIHDGAKLVDFFLKALNVFCYGYLLPTVNYQINRESQ